jgi:hypothetical protein
MGHTLAGILSRIEGDESQPQRDPGGAHKETLVSVRHHLRHTFTALQEKAAKIRDNKSLSEVGRREQLIDLAKKTDLSFLTRSKEAAESTIAQLRGLLFAVPKSEHEPMMGFAREREIRDWYKDKPESVLIAAYARAVEGGDHERVRALTQGPLGSLVNADYQQRVQAEAAEKSQPAVFANYGHAQNLQEHLNSLEVHAKSVLHQLGDA